MKSQYENYAIEDLATEQSFINYCLQTNTGDVEFWNEWILNHPERTQEIKAAKSIVLKYSLGLNENELNEERDSFIARLDSQIKEAENEGRSIKLPVWTYVGRIAAVLVIVFGVTLSVNYLNNQPVGALKIASKTVKQNPTGQKSTIYLGDGTKVILNAASRIEYDDTFGNQYRKVKLIGEAFFEVSRDPSKPFIVETGELHTTVLGTSFNINAYPDQETVKVAVVSGSVAVGKSSDEQSTVRLKPEEMATYHSEKKDITSGKFDMEEVVSWKDGIIFFRNATEKQVLTKLEKWYGVKILVNNKSPRPWDITAEYDNLSLANVLESLSFAADFQYEIDKKKVLLKY